jgi:hypothetical protein
MECDKIKKFYLKYCDAGLTQNENYNISYPVAKEIRTQNCFKSMQLLIDHCKSVSNQKPNLIYDEK